MLALVGLAAGCGNRLSHDRLVADARAENGTTQQAGSGLSSSGATTIGGSTGGGGATVPTIGDAAGSGVPDGAVAPAGSQADGGQTGASGTAAAEAAAGCTGSESHVVVASVGQLSGPAGNGVADMVRATQAWVAMVNARGGLHCHPVDYLVADDGGDPARQQALAQQMVEQHHVIAMVTPVAALTGRASADYLTQHRIPSIGGVAGPWAYDSPMFFPASAGGGHRAGVYATADWARLRGKSKLAVVTCAESSDCANVNAEYAQYGPEAGLSIVYNGQASALQPDYTSVCQAAQRSGAELFAPVLGPAGLQRLAQSCARVNYKPLYIVPGVTAQPQMAADPNLTPLGDTLGMIPWTETANPAIAEMHEALKRYAPSVEPGPASVAGWVSAKLFEEATRDLTDFTSESILGALWQMQGDDLGGLTVPLTFTRDQNPPASECWWLVEGDGGSWSSPNGGQRGCL